MSAAIPGDFPHLISHPQESLRSSWGLKCRLFMSTQWLRATECPLLQNADDGVDVPRLRLVQRLLEIALQRKTSEEVMQALLPETAAPLRAEHIGIWEATPDGDAHQPRNHSAHALERDPRSSGRRQPGPLRPGAHLLGACLSYVDRPNRVLLALRPREAFSCADLECLTQHEWPDNIRELRNLLERMPI